MTQQQGALSLLHALAHNVRHVRCRSQQLQERFADALGSPTAAADASVLK